jgi:hypothetical protein
MHSRTVKDPERVRMIDPNAYWTAGAATGAEPAEEVVAWR